MLDASACILRVPAEILKNDEDHDFILTAALAQELANLPAIGDYNKDVKSKERGRNRNPERLFGFTFNSAVYRYWRRACTAAGITYVPPHQAGRHSFATTYVVDNKVDPVTAAKLGGWKDVSMFVKRYPHARTAKLRAIVEKVSGGEQGAVTPKLKVIAGKEEQ